MGNLLSNLMLCVQNLKLHCCKGLIQVSDDIINMLSTDGEANGTAADTYISQLLISELGMGGGSWMNNQRLHISNICKEEKIFRLSMNLKASSWPPLISNVKIEPPPLGKYF